ncbi:right-handed parallel beta-helix repeat-containing protein, partial [Candidatus Woesearchaeota archaeon]|nr:right-handed parallel beta-helix repeat-containing protein [Candidatus Woesearchaeota archaeon]
MQAMILVVLISVISGYIYFTGEDYNTNKTLTPTGFAIYDNNPRVDVVVPDMDLKNKYGYFTGHGEMTEREDNKFDVVLSSSPGIPGLVHADQMPEAIIEINGLDTNNQSISINSTIDVLEEGAKDYDEIKTAVFAMDSVPIENATITLPKTAYTQYILRCEDFDQENFECVSEGYDINGWEITEIPFIDNGDTITFTVTHFTGYAGGGTNETNSANLTIWDNTDSGMFHGGQEKYVLENVEFFANYTMLNGSAISGAGASCVINFSDGNNSAMNFVDAYQLYEYDRTFSSSGTFGFNISCDGSLIGYVPLNATDNVTISSLIMPQGQGGVAPSVTIPVFNESSVNATLNINASVNYTDPESDTGTLYFNWFVNNAWVYEDIVTSVATNANVSRQLNTGNYSGNATITIEVTPYDGTTNGTKRNSTTYFQICLTPYDNLTVKNNVTLCAGTYNIQDVGTNGVIISGTNDANISCDGTRLVGASSDYGIYIGTYDFNIIKGCTIEKYSIGSYMERTGHNETFINNTFLSNPKGIALQASAGGTSSHNNITNNTFFNSTTYSIALGTDSNNNLVWGNRFLGTSSSYSGIIDSGTNNNFCVNDLYGNYYDDLVQYGSSSINGRVIEEDCGPAPNATIMLYDKSTQYNWSWGSTGTATFNNLREAVYNTENNRTIKGFPESGTFWYNDTDTVRSNITLDCNGVVFDSKYTDEDAIAFQGEDYWVVKNCTFSRYSKSGTGGNGGIKLNSGSDNNTLMNNTFLSNAQGIFWGSGTIYNTNITNNTFFNNTQEGIDAGGVSTQIWGNVFLGGTNGDGINSGGTNTNYCVNDLYGNYYDNNVGYAEVIQDDCGPAPNATIWLYDKSTQYNWSWSSTGTATFNN